MKDRIQLIMHRKQLTSARFADDLGVPRSTISHILSGRNKPSLEFVMKVLDSYPEVTAEWLLYGKGDAPEGGGRDLFGGHAGASAPAEGGEEPPGFPSEAAAPLEEEDDAVLGASGGPSPVSGRKASPGGFTGVRQPLPDMLPERVLVFYPDGSFSCHYPRTAPDGESNWKAR